MCGGGGGGECNVVFFFNDTATTEIYTLSLHDALPIYPLNDPNSPLSQRVVYFDFDSSEVSTADRNIISAHAEYLANHPNVAVILEGHTDERGSREYNIALGERRARAVQQLMLLQGVAQKQIQVISFGEERPVALGHDEASWHLNRRVEILYSGK